MIRGGSLAGSGDDYTIEKRLSGKPSQMVCVCNKRGVACYYPIELDQLLNIQVKHSGCYGERQDQILSRLDNNINCHL